MTCLHTCEMSSRQDNQQMEHPRKCLHLWYNLSLQHLLSGLLETTHLSQQVILQFLQFWVNGAACCVLSVWILLHIIILGGFIIWGFIHVVAHIKCSVIFYCLIESHLIVIPKLDYPFTFFSRLWLIQIQLLCVIIFVMT